jgi:c-di-GMP-binding flagellar brake protein YcgR
MVHKAVPPGSAIEHEAFLRAPYAGRVEFWVGTSATGPGLGAGRELSVGGLFVQSDEVLAEGSRATLKFDVGARTVTVRGEVVRVVKGGMLHAAGMGMRFLDLTPDDQRTIIEYVVNTTR